MLALALLLLLPPPLLLAVDAEQCDGPEMGGLCGLVLARCDAAEPDRALWSLPAPGAKPPRANVALQHPARWRGKVVDIGGWNNQTGGWLHVWNRTAADVWQAINQQWRTEPAVGGAAGAVRVVSLMNGLCLAAHAAEPGAHVETDNCSGVGDRAHWVASGGELRLAGAPQPALCLSVESRVNCSSFRAGGGAVPRFCDSALPVRQRAADLASRLTVDEMLSVMSPAGGPVSRLGLPVMGHQECQHGVWTGAKTCGAGTSGAEACATSFPNLLSVGASFNRSLSKAVAHAIAVEVRALHNDGQRAGLTCWAPNANLFRDPRWGRGMEVFSEDAYLTGQLVEQYVRGLQGEGAWRQATATCKHTYTYDMVPRHPQCSFFRAHALLTISMPLLRLSPALTHNCTAAAYRRVSGLSTKSAAAACS